MKKTVLLVCACLIASANLLATAQQLQDVVYLNNGSIIRGLIVEQIPNVSIKVETKDGSLFVYKMDEIMKFTKEEVRDATFARNTSGNKRNGYKGYYGDINFGYSIKFQNTDCLDLQIVNGYQFSPYFGLGGGVGVKLDGSGISIPIFANFRSEFLQGPITPYASLNVGYNVAITSFYNGFYMEPKVGVSFSVSPKTKLNFGLSYTLNNAIYRFRSSYRTYEELWSGFRLSVGVKF